MKNIKKIAAIVLACFMLFALTACGGEKSSSDPNVGIYHAATAEMWDMEMEVTDLWEGGFSIELKDGGKCSMKIDGNSANAKWTLEDGAFTVKGGGLDCSGTLGNGVMVLENVLNMDVTLTLCKEGADERESESAPEKTSIAPDESSSLPEDQPSENAKEYFCITTGSFDSDQWAALDAQALAVEQACGVAVCFAMIDDSTAYDCADIHEVLELLSYGMSDTGNVLYMGFDEAEGIWSWYIEGDIASALTEEDIDALWDAYDSAETYYDGLSAYLELAQQLLTSD